MEIRAEVRATLAQIPVIEIQGPKEEREDHARILQGIRHVSGVKAWGPYQQALLVARMIADGYATQDIRETLGLSAQRINSLRRVHVALEQMRSDSDYAAFAKPNLFSHIEEALKVPGVRQWLDWDDTQGMRNDERRALFYSWLVGVEEDGERLPPKLIDAKDIRRFPDLLADEEQFRRFVEDPRLALRDAVRTATPPPVDLEAVLRGVMSSLERIQVGQLSEAGEADTSELHRIAQQCETLIRQIEAAATPGSTQAS